MSNIKTVTVIERVYEDGELVKETETITEYQENMPSKPNYPWTNPPYVYAYA